MSEKKDKPTLPEVVDQWVSMLNSNAQASLGKVDKDFLVTIVGAWLRDVTEELRGEGRNVAFVDPEQHRRLRGLIAATMAKLLKDVPG